MEVERTEVIEVAEVLAEKAQKYTVIRNEVDAALVGEFRARLNAHIKDLDKERLEMGEGARQTLARINAKYNEKINELKGYLGQTDKALNGWLAEQKRKAEEAERARRAAEQARMEAEEQARLAHELAKLEAEELGTEPPPPPELPPEPELPAPVIPTNITGSAGSKVSAREVWKYRIVDIKKVPEQYLVAPEDRVNKSVLNALAKSQKDQAKVKGIEFYCEDTIQSRVLR